jgi:hypothetical protein
MSLREFIPGYRSTLQAGTWFTASKDATAIRGDELWCQGASDVELWLQTMAPIGTAVFEVRDLAPGNVIDLDLGSAPARLEFGEVPAAGEKRRIELTAGGAHRPASHYKGCCYLYRLLVRSRTGEAPSWRGSSREDFYLGAALTYLGTRADLDADLYPVEWGACQVPERLAAGETTRAITRVTNRSQATWPATGATRVTLSYHWLDASGAAVAGEGLRTYLIGDIGPGELVAMEQQVQAPAEPGMYTLALDLVRERVIWFSQRNGGNTFKARVEVVAPAPGQVIRRPRLNPPPVVVEEDSEGGVPTHPGGGK